LKPLAATPPKIQKYVGKTIFVADKPFITPETFAGLLIFLRRLLKLFSRPEIKKNSPPEIFPPLRKKFRPLGFFLQRPGKQKQRLGLT